MRPAAIFPDRIKAVAACHTAHHRRTTALSKSTPLDVALAQYSELRRASAAQHEDRSRAELAWQVRRSRLRRPRVRRAKAGPGRYAQRVDRCGASGVARALLGRLSGVARALLGRLSGVARALLGRLSGVARTSLGRRSGFALRHALQRGTVRRGSASLRRASGPRTGVFARTQSSRQL